MKLLALLTKGRDWFEGDYVDLRRNALGKDRVEANIRADIDECAGPLN